MFSFFKSFFGSASNDSRMDTEMSEVAAAAADGLDIQMAIGAHENWKLRLQGYLDGTSKEEFSAEAICFDDRCDLGKWIHSSGQARLGKYPGFTALVNHHKMFHYAASNVVSLAKSGRADDARKMLEGQFSSFSKSVVGDLQMFQSAVSAGFKREA
jgi:hypothetical protein